MDTIKEIDMMPPPIDMCECGHYFYDHDCLGYFNEVDLGLAGLLGGCTECTCQHYKFSHEEIQDENAVNYESKKDRKINLLMRWWK